MESIQNPQASRISPQKAQKPHTFSQWAQKYFQQHCSICLKQNPSIFICSCPTCLVPNPFICGKPQCQCLQSHSQCPIRSITPLLKQIQTRQTPTQQLIETIQSTMNEIIDDVSTSKQHILKLLREGMINSVVEDVGEIREYNIRGLFERDLRGSVLGQLVNYNEEANAEQRRFHTFKMQTAKLLRDFKLNKLNPFLSQVIQKFFSQNPYFFWQPSLKQPSFTVTKTRIINKSTDRKMKLCLLSPGISKLYGPTFRWRIRIVKSGKEDCWIGLGIGLREQIKKRSFIFDEGENYSCYMIANTGKTYSAFDKVKDNQTNYGFEFTTNDVIQLQLDTKQWVIRFRNERTSRSTTLKIHNLPQPEQDDYHICIGSNTKDTEVELISPIESEVANYMICA